jgi:hypothetical protein
MITASDSLSTYDKGKYYVILPSSPGWKIADFLDHFKARKVKEGFNYSSMTNSDWLSVEDLRNLINQHLNPDIKL